MLRRRRAAQINRQSVPYGSTKVEYLESSGTQWIDTKYIFNDKVGVSCDFSYYDSNKVMLLMGTQNQDTPKPYGDFSQILLNYDKNDGIDVTIPSYTSFGSGDDLTVSPNVRHSVSLLSNGKATLNNELRRTNIVSGRTNTYILSFYLFTRHEFFNGCHYIPSTENFIGKIYNFSFYENQKEIIKYIPSIDKTGTPCMFDLVSRKNFYNAGTGQFIYPTTSTTYSLRRPKAEWAKITDTGVHKIYHTPIGYEGSLEEYAIENGYKRLIETESPNEEGKYYSFKWFETDDTLTTEWFEVETPQEEIYQE